jgi:hypothetical protein
MRWIRLKVTGEARRFSSNFFRPPACESSSKIPRQLVHLLAVRILIANGAHSSICSLFIHQLVNGNGNLESIPNGGVKKLTPECCNFSICNGAKNAPSCWKVRKEACRGLRPVPAHIFFSIPARGSKSSLRHWDYVPNCH